MCEKDIDTIKKKKKQNNENPGVQIQQAKQSKWSLITQLRKQKKQTRETKLMGPCKDEERAIVFSTKFNHLASKRYQWGIVSRKTKCKIFNKQRKRKGLLAERKLKRRKSQRQTEVKPQQQRHIHLVVHYALWDHCYMPLTINY